MTEISQSPKDASQDVLDVEDAVMIEDTAQSARENGSPKTAKNGLLWLFTVINLLMLLLAIAGAAYWYLNQTPVVVIDNTPSIVVDTDAIARDMRDMKDDLSEQSRTLQSSVVALQQNTLNLESDIVSIKQSNSQALRTIQDELTQVENSAAALSKSVAEMSSRRPSDWLLAEANYLVNMAGRKIYLEKDVRTAMTLLKEADTRLNDLNDPSLFPVRALIAADIQALNQVNQVSTTSIALAIAGMLEKVSGLPLDKLQLPESNNTEDLQVSENISDWRQNLQKTWRSIVGDLITIDYVGQPLEPYLAERQQWLIEQQLKHALSQAQLAALNEQVALYRSAMQQAMGLLVEHYQMDSVEVSQFLVALQELQNMDFSRNYPLRLESQASLKGIIEQRIQSLFNNAPTSKSDNLGNPL